MKNTNLKSEIIGLSPNSKKIKEYKNSLTELNNAQKEAIIGLMLGGGYQPVSNLKTKVKLID